jgi:hypothetical protein
MLPNFAVQAQGLQEWGTCVVDNVPTLKCFEVIFANILTISTGLIFLALFVMLVVGAFKYLTSLGNPEKVKKAQGTLTYAVIGLIIFLSAFLILKTIDFLFLGNQNKIFQFEIPS